VSFARLIRWLGAAAPGAAARRVSCAVMFALIALIFTIAGQALALEPISIDPDKDRIDVTAFGELYEGRGDRLQIETVPGPDGIVGRMAVQATTTGTDPNWIVFALKNATGKPIVRWLTAQRYTLVGSSVFWPDLDSGRIAAITPSLGFRPDRISDDRADIFRLTIEPGAIITFIAEMSSLQVPRLNLWKPEAYERQLKDRMLFNGILLGIVALTAIFLTAVFAANHKSIFPAAALVAWTALALFCVDFGFWHKLFKLSAEDNAVYRAASEAAFAASLVIFLYSFLRVQLWHSWIKLGFAAWIMAQVALMGLTVIDPQLASGLARASLSGIGVIGALLITYLALRGQERAMSLVPTWMLVLVWIFGGGLIISGQLSGDIIVSGLLAGLVLLIVLLGFTVTQYAFRGSTPFHGGQPGQMQLSTLALEGAGTAVWQWNIQRGEFSVGPEVEDALGLPESMLEGSLEEWLRHIHPADRDRFRLMLWSIQETGGGELNIDIRMQHTDGSYMWFELRAHSVESTLSTSSQRYVGLMRDVTGPKRTQERLLHDAVHDSLTGLPNRELFLDRLRGAVMRAEEGTGKRPTVLYIDIDRFKNVNKSLGLVVGDSLLLTLARRLTRHLNPQDTMARIGGDQFAVLIVSESEPQHIALLSERIRRSLRSPIRISGKEIILTGSIGIAVYDGEQETHQDLLKEAEIAMFRAKRSGADRIDIFKASMRGSEEGRLPLESELRRAIERKQIKVMYQPITNLEENSLSGFEALVRWDHPKHGRLNPDDFVPIAEETGLISGLGGYVIEQAMKQAARWQKTFPRTNNPIFVSVNVSSAQLFRKDLLQQIRSTLSRDTVPRGTLWLEVTESLVMENPEQAIEILGHLKGMGAGLSLDDFGTGYSSLNYLHRFPVDTIKVDKSFLREAERNGNTQVILRSIVAMAHELGKKVVAEGVEASEDADFLRSIGCEYAQGFYFGEPMSEKGAMSLVSALAKAEKKKAKKARPRILPAPGRKQPVSGAAKKPAPSAPASKEKTGGQPKTAAAGAPMPVNGVTTRQA